MQRVIVPLLLGFGVTLALVIGQRLSTDAMAVVLGTAVGVAASVPTSFLLVALLRRAQRDAAHALPPVSAPPPPNIVVLNPADLNRQLPPPGPFFTVGDNFQPLLAAGRGAANQSQRQAIFSYQAD